MESPVTNAEHVTGAQHDHANPANVVQCNCGQNASRERVKKYGPTQGQYFWTCATWPSPDRCSFFQWVNEREGKRLSYKGHRVATRQRFSIQSHGPAHQQSTLNAERRS